MEEPKTHQCCPTCHSLSWSTRWRSPLLHTGHWSANVQFSGYSSITRNILTRPSVFPSEYPCCALTSRSYFRCSNLARRLPRSYAVAKAYATVRKEDSISPPKPSVLPSPPAATNKTKALSSPKIHHHL